jgi:hypothetical protein
MNGPAHLDQTIERLTAPLDDIEARIWKELSFSTDFETERHSGVN